MTDKSHNDHGASKLVSQSRAAAAKHLPCSSCGSTREPAVCKPTHGSAEWWDDPSPYIGCADCGAFMTLAPDVYPSILQADELNVERQTVDPVPAPGDIAEAPEPEPDPILADPRWCDAIDQLTSLFTSHSLRLEGGEVFLAPGAAVLIDVEPVPVLVEIDDKGGGVWLSASIGSVPGSEEDESLKQEYEEEFSRRAADFLWEGEEIRTYICLDGTINDHQTQTLALAVRGMASLAAEHTDLINDFGSPLLSPLTYQETLETIKGFEPW